MRDSIMEDQDELIIRKSEYEELGLETNNKAVLEDVGQNAEYIAFFCNIRGNVKFSSTLIALERYWVYSYTYQFVTHLWYILFIKHYTQHMCRHRRHR